MVLTWLIGWYLEQHIYCCSFRGGGGHEVGGKSCVDPDSDG